MLNVTVNMSLIVAMQFSTVLSETYVDIIIINSSALRPIP